jgi:uncharacterized protein (DUF1697 family)
MAKPYHALYISFLSAAPTADRQQAVLKLATDADQFHVADRELYWLSRTPTMRSSVSGALLERTLGMAATARNATTVRKLAVRCAGASR